jgi:hypothetical protein
VVCKVGVKSREELGIVVHTTCVSQPGSVDNTELRVPDSEFLQWNGESVLVNRRCCGPRGSDFCYLTIIEEKIYLRSQELQKK